LITAAAGSRGAPRRSRAATRSRGPGHFSRADPGHFSRALKLPRALAEVELRRVVGDDHRLRCTSAPSSLTAMWRQDPLGGNTRVVGEPVRRLEFGVAGDLREAGGRTPGDRLRGSYEPGVQAFVAQLGTLVLRFQFQRRRLRSSSHSRVRSRRKCSCKMCRILRLTQSSLSTNADIWSRTGAVPTTRVVRRRGAAELRAGRGDTSGPSAALAPWLPDADPRPARWSRSRSRSSRRSVACSACSRLALLSSGSLVWLCSRLALSSGSALVWVWEYAEGAKAAAARATTYPGAARSYRSAHAPHDPRRWQLHARIHRMYAFVASEDCLSTAAGVRRRDAPPPPSPAAEPRRG
jgi:hypothetical protein